LISLSTTLSTRRRLVSLLLIAAAIFLLMACGGEQQAPTPPTPTQETAPTTAVAEATTVEQIAATDTPTESMAAPQSADAQGLATPTPDEGRVPAYGFTVINTYPHDTGAYTQGLQFVDGVFYEGTGRHGASSLRRVEVETGAVLQQHDLAEEYFGEGIVVIDDRIYQLTWQEQTAFLYDRETFAEIERFSYATEGWGLTFDGAHVIMSDGSNNLFFRDPTTFEELGRVAVTYLGAPLTRLNELEFIDGVVWANVYQSNYIAQIDPETGIVVGIVDLTGILDTVEVTQPVDVLNGIAWDAENERLFVTGKWWPAVFEITLQQKGWAQ
jgi:glutamine cyclotransferase